MADNPPPLHVHFGLGALGVGLVLAQHDPEQMQLVVVGRSSTAALSERAEAAGEVRLRVDDVERPIAVPCFVRWDTDDGFAALVKLFTEDRDLLVTTTVKGGQLKVIDLLLRLLGLRRDATEAATVIVPCENVLDPGWTQVRQGGHVAVARHVLVDRICSVIDVDGVVVVDAEDYCEWKVSFDDGVDGSLVERAGMALSDDIVFEKQRKLVLVNDVQFAAAALALVDDHDDMATYLATAKGSLALRGLLLEGSLVLATEFKDQHHPIEEILAYSRIAGARIANKHDNPMRIIRDGAAGPYEWLVDVYRKLVIRMDEPLMTICQILGSERLSGSMLGKARLALDEIISRVMGLN